MEDITEQIGKLRRKEGKWLEWGQGCQALQKAGMSPQEIFEQTGFEPIYQNQLIVASQVYATIGAGALQFFEQKGSDILYELRLLPQTDSQREKAAALIVQMGLTVEDTRQLVRAMKEFMLLNPPPSISPTTQGMR